METLQLIGSAAGLGLLAGIRLYATVLGLGLALRWGWLTPPGGQTHLLADTRVLAVAALAMLVEFAVDKIPWVDSLWDSLHTFIRPLGAALIAGGLLASHDEAAQFAVMLLSGSVALTGHASKSAARLLVNHSPEPFSNVALSFLEDLLTPLGLWVVVAHPLLALAVVAVFLALFVWLSPRIYRLVRMQSAAIAALGRSWFGAGRPGTRWVGELPKTFRPLAPYMAELPQSHAALVARKYQLAEVPPAVRAAAVDIRKLRHSIGYLLFAGDELVFVTRRALRYRQHSIELAAVESVELRKGIFLDRLLVRTRGREYRFAIFKAA